MTTIDSKPPRKRDVAVQLNTRVSLDNRELLDEVVAREGISLRAAVEMAIRSTWGSGAQKADPS
ncbi:hypothetical protein [Herbiconiux ginsengi]|uniref:Ribbon-helix-helix protein, copG family n=1 Tax=Herbiconiux ginsengi TaxID=381665 RepID=A0A1H3TFP3_9MICO|nr:hypothetical protein [Herbiconiux ginsengi]SDZ48485.1 hypothetical protein SAMN05216554_4130 [Herbiconiux ginsengi]